MKLSRQQYLTEDLAQIQRYFPGAKPVALRTPFDLTKQPRKLRIPDSIDRQSGHILTSRHSRPQSGSRAGSSRNPVIQSAHGAITSVLDSYLMTLDSVSRRRTRWMA